jgi:predicted nuclease of restriction endonuclease-like (RecB) superfamily
MGRLGGDPWSRISPKISEPSFPALVASSLLTCGESSSFIKSTPRTKKLAPLVREISWTNNLVILERCKDSPERQFYLERTKQFGWTKNALIHQIDNKSYEKTLLNQTNFDTALPEHIRNQPKLAVKDEYTFDFMEFANEHRERQLEQAILAKVEPFLLEMSGMFSLSEASTAWTSAARNIFISLTVLFYRRLRLLVAFFG